MYIAQHNRSEKKQLSGLGAIQLWAPSLARIAKYTRTQKSLSLVSNILLLAGSDGVRKTNNRHELLYKRMEKKFDIIEK